MPFLYLLKMSIQIFKLCDIINAYEVRFESNIIFFEDKKRTFLNFDGDK